MAIARSSAAASMTYSFPPVSVDEAMFCLTELQVPASVEDLTNPKPQSTCALYAGLLEYFRGITLEQLSQPKFQGIGHLGNPDLHEGSVPTIAFFRAMNELLTVCDVHDFSMRDIIHPTRESVMRHLAAMLNLARFREDRLLVYQEMTRETAELKRQRDEVALAYEGVRKQLSVEEAKRAEAEPEIQKLQADNARLREEIEEKNKLQAQLQGESKDLKVLTSTLRDQVSSLQYESLELVAAQEKLESQIVRSPERLRSEMASMTAHLEDEKRAILSVEREKREALSKTEVVTTVTKEVKRVMQLLDEVQSEHDRYLQAVKDQNAAQHIIDVHDAEMKELEARRSHMERRAARVEEKAKAFRPTAEIKTSATKRAIAEAEQELSGIRAEIQNATNAKSSAEQERRQLVAKLADEKTAHNAEMAEMSKLMERLLLAQQQHISTLRAQLVL